MRIKPIEQAYQLGYQDGTQPPDLTRPRTFDDPRLAESYERGLRAGRRDAQLERRPAA